MIQHQAYQYLHHKSTRKIRKRARDLEPLEEIMTKHFPQLGKEKDTQAQEVQRVPRKMYSKRPTQTHIIIEMEKFKNKENNKSFKRKAVACKTAR